LPGLRRTQLPGFNVEYEEGGVSEVGQVLARVLERCTLVLFWKTADSRKDRMTRGIDIVRRSLSLGDGPGATAASPLCRQCC